MIRSNSIRRGLAGILVGASAMGFLGSYEAKADNLAVENSMRAIANMPSLPNKPVTEQDRRNANAAADYQRFLYEQGKAIEAAEQKRQEEAAKAKERDSKDEELARLRAENARLQQEKVRQEYPNRNKDSKLFLLKRMPNGNYLLQEESEFGIQDSIGISFSDPERVLGKEIVFNFFGSDERGNTVWLSQKQIKYNGSGPAVVYGPLEHSRPGKYVIECISDGAKGKHKITIK